jgi:hypothetical protein
MEVVNIPSTKLSLVMAGLVPAIHVFVLRKREDVDARHKAGHDDVVGLKRYAWLATALPIAACAAASRAIGTR